MKQETAIGNYNKSLLKCFKIERSVSYCLFHFVDYTNLTANYLTHRAEIAKHLFQLLICIRIHIDIHMYIHIYIYLYDTIYIYVHIHICICLQIAIHVYIYVYIP